MSKASSAVLTSPEWIFSKKASAAADEEIYPRFFNRPRSSIIVESTTLESESKRHQILDGTLGIDKCLKITLTDKDYKLPREFTVQERWRRPSYSSFKDITLTEWNNKSNTPSEVYKIQAWFFVYGFYDERLNQFSSVYILNVPQLFLAHDLGYIDKLSEQTNRRNQSFWPFDVEELKKHGIIVFQYERNSAGKVEIGRKTFK